MKRQAVFDCETFQTLLMLPPESVTRDASRSVALSPQFGEIQCETGKQRISRNRFRIIQRNDFVIGPIHIHLSLHGVDQPAQICAVLDVFEHLEIKRRKIVTRGTKLNDKVWTNRSKFFFAVLLDCPTFRF